MGKSRITDDEYAEMAADYEANPPTAAEVASVEVNPAYLPKGRPNKGTPTTGKTPVLAIRLPESLRNELEHRAKIQGATPSPAPLGEIADDPRTRALCVVPWVKGEVDAWAAAADPELLGPASGPEPKSSLDPVVVEGLKTLTHSVNLGNNLAGSLDRRDAVAVLRTLQEGGYRLHPDPIYSWALANGWQARGAERLRKLATDFEAGKRPRLKGSYPFRSDILDIWRRDAEDS